MAKFEIWWSPVDHENGRKVVDAPDKEAAKKMAFDEMRKRSLMGAYGANEASPSP